MKPIITIIALLIFIINPGCTEPLFAQVPETQYLPGRVIVKLQPSDNAPLNHRPVETQPKQDGSLNSDPADPAGRLSVLLEMYDPISIIPVFGHQALTGVHNLKFERSDISDEAVRLAGSLQSTYTVIYGSDDDPADVAAEIERFEGVAYAEPHYIHHTMELYYADDPYIPNDPFIGRNDHNYFEYLNLFRAWGVNRGSADVVIAIIDTGVYYDHPDLFENLWRNPEPGRADPFFPEFDIHHDSIGWNFWESGDIFRGEPLVQNADPAGNFSIHGTLVAGIAAAVTDNAEGIAGAGFRSRFMPVKTGGTREYPNTIAFGYHGILYAAINGADVINCSFVGAGRSRFGSEVILFAQAMGSLVVAATGNDGISTRSTTPASFDEVLAVGAVSGNLDDRLATFSNYGPIVDVFAVGQNMLSTTFQFDAAGNTYTPGYRVTSGTSMSTPLVSGLAALIKAENPDWPPQQIASQIRGTARSISHANPGPQYAGLLGYGLIDAYAALTAEIPLINLRNFSIKNDSNENISIGESGTLTIEGVHFGRTSPGILFELESIQPGITIHTAQITGSGFGPGEHFSIQFPLTIENHYQLDVIPALRLNWSVEDTGDPTYIGSALFEYEELLYGKLDNNRLTMTIPSDGTIGFMHPEVQSTGFGFIPDGHENILTEAGFMISGKRDGERVMINQVRDSTGISRHFIAERNFRVRDHPEIRNARYGTAMFRPIQHPAADELEIEVTAITVNTTIIDRSVLLSYRIRNNSDHIYSDLYFGIFNNWAFRRPGLHHTFFSEDEQLHYIRHESGPPYAGIAVKRGLSGALAIDNRSVMDLGRAESRMDSLSFGIIYSNDDDRLDGFTNPEKHLALTSGTERTTLSADDISTVTGTGPYTLYPHSGVTIGFVYAWETSEAGLKNQIRSALSQEFLMHDEPGGYTYTGRVADELTLHPNFPNPFNNRTTMRFDLIEPAHVELRVYDLLGRLVATLVNEFRESGPHFLIFDTSSLASGTYLAILRTGGQLRSDKLMLVK